MSDDDKNHNIKNNDGDKNDTNSDNIGDNIKIIVKM